MFKFEKMIAWQKAVEFADRAFEVADRWPQRYQFSLGEQLRRAALSITNNLAEGSGRRTPASRRAFCDTAKGSTYEVVSLLAIALRRKETTRTEFDQFYRAGDERASIISGLIDSTFKEEGDVSQTPRAIRESDMEYETPSEIRCVARLPARNPLISDVPRTWIAISDRVHGVADDSNSQL
jgi:four helix bundle protein